MTNVIARDSLHLGQLRFQEQARLTKPKTMSSQAECLMIPYDHSADLACMSQIHPAGRRRRADKGGNGSVGQSATNRRGPPPLAESIDFRTI